MKKGFTLSEIIIAVAIIGVIAALTIPALTGMMPNKELLMFRKAYYLTERTVADLVNDEDLYPPAKPGQEENLGNDTEVIRYKGEDLGGPTQAAREEKFCKAFAINFNYIGERNCSKNLKFEAGKAPVGTFTTSDNIVWLLPVDVFDDNNTPQEIKVDVNGDNGPNCFYSSTCSNPDRLTIKVYQDGRVVADGDMEKEYLTRSNTHQGAKNETIKK